MDLDKSLDDSYYPIIAALLHDVHSEHGRVFNIRSLRLTLQKVRSRLNAEGPGFLTKALPRLAKAFDSALAGQRPLDSTLLGFKTQQNSKLPRFLGELFNEVLSHNGVVLQQPNVQVVRVIRDILYCFYKYELPYTNEQEQQVIDRFKSTEGDLGNSQASIDFIDRYLGNSYQSRSRVLEKGPEAVEIARKARRLLSNLFAFFDPKDIHPRHGPGAVATRQKLGAKYVWTNISAKITQHYPIDAYFCASMGHVCDHYKGFSTLGEVDHPARVILVPKDSRGPRLISCEPVDYQWVQQGLGRAIVQLVESHVLTKHNVHFTDQTPNRLGALIGSRNYWYQPDGTKDGLAVGRYATLDLNEASDRVSLDLVRLLFPSHVYTYLEACRSSSTELPSGEILKLRKFAPMGSALCFPVLALTVWAILTAGAPDKDTRESILVYGDDVIVPTAHAENAMNQLELFGLKINRDKSCTSGFFRESCGMDAFMGVDVTPVRLRTVWSSTRSPDVYSSWIAYANSYWDRRYYHTYYEIVGRLRRLYGAIPDEDMRLACPSLRFVLEPDRPTVRRRNPELQKLEYNVWDIKSPKVKQRLNGWSMLLRYFAEATHQSPVSPPLGHRDRRWDRFSDLTQPFSVSTYTQRRTSILARCWR